MEIGIFSRTYETGDLEETCQRMTRQGIFHTQFNLSNAGIPTLPLEMPSEKKLYQIRKTMEAYGIRIHALSGTFNMIDPDESAREQGCRQFAIQCEIAARLEIPVVSLCTGSRSRESKWKWHEDNGSEAAWELLLRSTEEVLKVAKRTGRILGVEPEVSNVISSPALARKYLDEVNSSHLQIIMDGANLFHSGQKQEMDRVLEEAFTLLGQNICLAHAKDVSLDRKLDFVAAGQGDLDFPRYVRLLQQYGYTGPLILHGLTETQVPASRDFLKEVIKNARISP